MSPPRIGIDVTSALTQGGGIGRYTRELVRALASLNSQNRFTFFSARVPENPQLQNPLPTGPGIDHRSSVLSERWLYRLWYRLRIPLPIQTFSGPLDLFHSPDFVLPPIGSQIPSLLTVHDLSFVFFPDTFPDVLVKYLRKVVPWSVSRATHVLADSQSTKDDLMALWRVPGEKISVLYSGVSSEYRPIAPSPECQSVCQRYRLSDQPYILSVGTVQPRKNYQMLIKAFVPVAREFPHNLAIAGGKGWLEEEIRIEAARQGLADRVRFLGFVADEDLPAIYGCASLFVFPSLYEGFGLPVLEAMACGVPVIMSNSSSLPEVGGDAVIQLPPDSTEAWSNGILNILSDSEKRFQMIGAGVNRARKFSWERAALELQEIYASLLDKANTSGHNTGTK